MKTIEQIALEVAEAPGNQEGVIEFAVAVHNKWLEQQSQEPVAWMNQYGAVSRVHEFADDMPMFLAPPPAIPEGYVLVPKEPSDV